MIQLQFSSEPVTMLVNFVYSAWCVFFFNIGTNCASTICYPGPPNVTICDWDCGLWRQNNCHDQGTTTSKPLFIILKTNILKLSSCLSRGASWQRSRISFYRHIISTSTYPLAGCICIDCRCCQVLNPVASSLYALRVSVGKVIGSKTGNTNYQTLGPEGIWRSTAIRYTYEPKWTGFNHMNCFKSEWKY